MFNRNNNTGTHRYAVYKDKKTGEVRAIQLTHLYEIPSNKLRQINAGHIREYKLKCYKLPSGVNTKYLRKDIFGHPIVLNSLNSIKSYKLSYKESRNLKRISSSPKN